MIVVGLTGNIGSGKSTVAKAFQALGIPFFNSDEEAKKLYAVPSIQSEVQEILNITIDFKKTEWKTQIAAIIFSDREKREKLETLIHEQVRICFSEWVNHQNSKYVIREAALANSFQPENCQWLIEVSANRGTRLKRVMNRSGISETEFNKRDELQRSNEEFPSSKKLSLSNNESDLVLPQILAIHEQLIR
jgi:dephospho-CoA kinase